MKVLVVDDDLVLSDVIVYTMRRAGFEVITAYDGHSAYARWEAEHPALVILDIQMPGIDGLSLCKRIRAQSSIPIIILSARDTDDDVVLGLDIGADDYIAKPFSPSQLVARANALLRRVNVSATQRTITFADLTFDTERREVRVDTTAEPIQLTQLESRLLEALILNAGNVLPHETLVNHVWGIDGGERTMLKQLVHRLRQKIDPDSANPRYIENIAGVGYAMVRT